jgi:tetratricopeptide (TPR) repeat protein
LFGWLRKFSRSDIAASGPYADALHRQGESANRAGKHREAAQLLMAAIKAKPGVAAFHYELGRAMKALEEPARAVTCFRAAIDLEPAMADAHVDLASALLALGDPDAAERSARAAIALEPQSTAALVNLGAALAGQNRLAEAADSYRAALAADTSCVAALVNLSGVCLRLGDLDEARHSIERALQLAPELIAAHLQLGSVLLEQRLPDRAAQCYREALRLQPGSAAAHNGLGFTFDIQGRLDEAMRCYEQALALEPENVQAHLNRASVWLARGDFARGWEEYEWRQRSREYAPLYGRFGLPRWDGSSLAGRRILVYAEQGLGDEIMFASCLPEIVAQAAHCVIDCEPRLAGLVRRSFPQATVHGGRQTDATDWLGSAGSIDVAIPAGSVPRHLRRLPASFPSQRGYLRADPERVAAWRDRLQRLGPGPKVGLSWRGGVPQTGRGSRSLSLTDLLPVLHLGGVTYVNLQYGNCDAELAAFRAQHGVEIHAWKEATNDYEETAALVCALDLTLSVCTAIVDLGGALGRPLWVMAPVRTDFRYGLEGDAMPWYPSVRVFRQSRYGEWQPVIAAVGAALAGLAS